MRMESFHRMVGSCLSSHDLPRMMSWATVAMSKPIGSSLLPILRIMGLKWMMGPLSEHSPFARTRTMGMDLGTCGIRFAFENCSLMKLP